MSATAGSPARVLVCEDAFGYRTLIGRWLEEADMEVCAEAESWTEAVELAGRLGPDAIVADLWMPELDTDALARLREAAPDALVVSLSGLGIDEQRELVDEGAVDLVLSKRQPPAEIVAALADLVARRRSGGG